MAFIPVKRTIAAAPISVLSYADDASVIDISFVAQYARHKRSEAVALNTALQNKHIEGVNKIYAAEGKDLVELVALPDGSIPTWTYETDEAFLLEKMNGWLEVTNEDETPKPFTKSALTEILSKYPELIVPLFNGFFVAHGEATRKEEKEKN